MKRIITIATLNTLGIPVLGPHLLLRYQKIGEYFDNSGVDVVQFQEVITYFHLKYLKNKLKSYPHCAYIKSFLGPKGGLVTFSRLPIENIDYKYYNRPIFLDLSLAEMSIFKGLQITTIANHDVVLLNTHLNSSPAWDWKVGGKYDRVMQLQINQYHELLGELTKKQKLIITTGDFNIEKDSKYYKKLTDFPQLFDPFSSHSGSTFRGNPIFKTQGDSRIDYIFLIGNKKYYSDVKTKELFKEKVKLKENLQYYVSDHTCLQISIQLLA